MTYIKLVGKFRKSNPFITTALKKPTRRKRYVSK